MPCMLVGSAHCLENSTSTKVRAFDSLTRRQYAVLGVAETWEIVALSSWVQLPQYSPHTPLVQRKEYLTTNQMIWVRIPNGVLVCSPFIRVKDTFSVLK